MDKTDDSTGNSFEIVDKVEQNNGDKSDTLSSISSPYSLTSPSSSGNLLSNVGPPSSLPDFTLLTPTPSAAPPPIPAPSVITSAPVIINQFPTTQFSPAIPVSKGIPQQAISQRRVPPEAEPVHSTSLLGMVKGALSSQVVSKMVEKAKSSVDSIITTLDPQMSEYIHSGGDLEITVASEEEDLVSSVREAAHGVFGKAWVNGIKLGTTPQKSQAVGLESALILAEERIDYSLKFRKTPTLAIESVLLKEGKGWYDVSLLLLKDEEKAINVHTFSQAVPVPVDKFIGKEVADIDVEQKLSDYLKTVPCWQEEISGLTRKEVTCLAAKVVFKLYKDKLQ